MSWNSLSEFLAMGGYGLYVWGSYVVTFLLIAVELALLAARHCNAKRAAQIFRGRTA